LGCRGGSRAATVFQGKCLHQASAQERVREPRSGRAATIFGRASVNDIKAFQWTEWQTRYVWSFAFQDPGTMGKEQEGKLRERRPSQSRLTRKSPRLREKADPAISAYKSSNNSVQVLMRRQASAGEQKGTHRLPTIGKQRVTVTLIIEWVQVPVDNQIYHSSQKKKRKSDVAVKRHGGLWVERWTTRL